MNEHRTVRVALLGAGSVGSQVARLLLENADELAARVGARLELVGIAVRNVDATRDVDLPASLITTDAKTLILGADLVVELMGGIDPAREYISLALESGADVVTANKALVATHGRELFDIAERVGAQLYYEAAVAGAIPIIRPLRDSLAGDRVDRILGIVNGTTNFILDRMYTRGGALDEALAVATELGYAEADPTADVDGYDAQQKAAILASIAFHTHVPVEQVYREGIRGVTAELIDEARASGYVVKLLAICERIRGADGETKSVSARVYPALVHLQHPLASVHGGNNAIFVEAAAAGSLMFYGAGAGGIETSSAVLGDVVSAARRRVSGGPGLRESMHGRVPVSDIGDVVTKYHISLDVNDELGVLARIAKVFSEHGVSVLQIQQGNVDERHPVIEAEAELEQQDEPDESPASATLVIGTHDATERSLQSVVEAIESLGVVQNVKGVLRVEGAA